MNDGMNLLFSSCGRRVELIQSFRQTLNEMGRGAILACDVDPLASALQVADCVFIVPPCTDDSFIPSMLDLCQEEKVKAVIPLIDTELGIYAKNKDLFLEKGTEVVVSDPKVIEICASKVRTASFFKSCDLHALRTIPLDKSKVSEDMEYPAVIKPDKGSGSIGVYKVGNEDEALLLSRTIPEPVLQELAKGQEVTVDCMVGRDGSLVRYVARERLEIRAGESSKGRTFKDAALGSQIAAICNSLEAFGPITIQCFREEGEYVFSEINPRFGGGYPLAQAAGADFPRILLRILRGETMAGEVDKYEENVYMTRFDNAFYLRKDKSTGTFAPL